VTSIAEFAAVIGWSLPGYESDKVFKFLSNINQCVNLTFITSANPLIALINISRLPSKVYESAKFLELKKPLSSS